ncbi:MAG TPA: hypothetical protein VMR16_03900 [Candidatus Saccharimonadales bacterium]|nr:hypothetical protein [Candidatus Saccharimonadales bacterium]
MIIMKSAFLKTELSRGVSKKNIIQTIKDKEMDRKDFLKYSGVALLGIVGLRGIATLLTVPDNQPTNNSDKKNQGRGFGSGKYGA